jgi:hypothetical protein
MTPGGRFLRFLLCSVLASQCLTASAVTLYRCEKNGVTEFRQTACPAGQERRIHVINSSSGLRPSEPGLRLKKMSEKTDKSSRKQPKAASEKPCWRKRQQLDRVERRLRAGYKASEYQRLHDRQREYEAYLRRFCR